MAKKVTAKNTKAEILSAFGELASERQALEKQLNQLEGQLTAAQRPPAPEPANGQQPATLTLTPDPDPQPALAAQRDIQQVVQSLDQLQVNFGSAAGNLSEQLLAEATQLAELQAAIARETEQLAELHDLTEIDDDTCEQLLQTYDDNRKTFAEEFEQRQDTLSQELAALQQAWAKERTDQRRAIQARDRDERQARERDEAEYGYNRDLARRLAQETQEQAMQQRYAELAAARQAQAKAWQEREAAIAEREQDYAAAQAKMDAFPSEREAKIAQGKAEGKGIGNYQAKVKADLRRQEIEGERQNYDLRLAALDRTLAAQDERLAVLADQLDAALTQVQDLAVKAIEGSANQRSFEALKEVTLEQARNSVKSK